MEEDCADPGLQLECDEVFEVSNFLFNANSPQEDSEEYEQSEGSIFTPYSEEKPDTKEICRKRAGIKRKRHYKSYTNSEKIYFLEQASKYGSKKAAIKLKISWSTAKAWIKKDQYFKETKSSYIDVLKKQGDKIKLGVGRKISYQVKNELELFEFVMMRREREEPLTIKDLKKRAAALIPKSQPVLKGIFKASDGWAKKFCIRNDIDLCDKFQLPRKMPETFLVEAQRFREEFREIRKRFTNGTIVFADKIRFNLATNQSTRHKMAKKFTVLLSVTHKGKLLKPFVILSKNMDTEISSKIRAIKWGSNDRGIEEGSSLINWIETVLGKTQSPLMLVSSHFFLPSSYCLRKKIIQSNISINSLPPGYGCLLSPLKDIIPEFLNAFLLFSKHPNPSHSSGINILNWISNAYQEVLKDEYQLLSSAFSCLIN